MSSRKLIFVYNADSGVVNTLKDYAHKVVKPSTYECNLCGLTYGNLGMRREWKGFIDGLPVPAEFLHKDEFVSRYPDIETGYPVAFMREKGELSPFIDPEEMNSIGNLDALIALVKKRLDQSQG